MEATNQPARGQEDLARQIYVELAARSFEAAEGGPRMRVKSDALTRLSLQLAADFYENKESIESSAKPKSEFKLEAAEWMK